MTLEDMRMAAAKGAVFADERLPGWYRRVDLGKLNLRNCTACVLGQLFGFTEARNPYWEGCEQLGLNSEDAIAYGFSLNELPVRSATEPLTEYVTRTGSSWDDLTGCWKQEITRRLEDDRAAA
jgi:hypothetical protein